MISIVEIFPERNTYISIEGNLDSTQEKLITVLLEKPIPSVFEDHPFLTVTTQSKEDQLNQIYCWSPHQIVVVDQETTIYTPENKITLPQHAFWQQLTQMAAKLKQTLSLTDKISRGHEYLGFYGYMAFELARLLEDYRTRLDKSRLPLLIMHFPTKILVQCKEKLILVLIDLPSVSVSNFNIQPLKLNQGIHHFTKYEEYISDISLIKEYIRKGDIYQANYTQQFAVNLPQLDLLELFTEIQYKQHLLGGAYLKFNAIEILSLSPEIFLQVTGGKVITKPIKGTSPRGLTPEEDEQYKSQLVKSTKDQAELAMIVDLLRNDLGKSSLPASVEVEEHAVVESYENVHHLVSTVTSRIDQDFESSWRMFLRAFPGGSISGVPKLRSLEIIESTEKVPRGVYTGNIGMINLSGDLSFNIAIRTAVITNQQAFFNAGGGIVFDSDPFSEYIESLHKAKHLARYFSASFTGHLFWLDGKLIENEDCKILPTTTGCFETILVENAKIRHLDQHLDRLKRGIEYYNFQNFKLPSQDEIHRFCELNLAQTARLNIYVFLKDMQVHVLMKVREYETPSGDIHLLLDSELSEIPKPFQLGIKSLDYALYQQKTSLAVTSGAWDTMIIDQNGLICEGGRSTLYFYTDHWVTPRLNIVHGIIRGQLIASEQVMEDDIKFDELDQINAIAVSNSLIGVRFCSRILDWQQDTIWRQKKHVGLPQLDKITDI